MTGRGARGVAIVASVLFAMEDKDENYYETISDALLEASTRAIEDEGFRKGLGAKWPPATPAGA
jgi:hypothetical protein